MEIQGTIIQVKELEKGIGKTSNKEWQKRIIVIETEDRYPTNICMTLWGKVAELDILKAGNRVTCGIDLESREYNGNWYTDVKAYKVNLISSDSLETAGDNEPNTLASNDELPF